MDKKLKPILPTLKEKKRYLVFEIISDNPVSRNQASEEIKQKIFEFLGQLTVAKAGIQLLNFWNNQKGIIRVGNKYVDRLKSALMLVKKIGSSDVAIKSVFVSGILDKAEKYVQ